MRNTGARVMSMDQMDGLAPVSDDDWANLTLGEEIDGGDPPRVWHPTLQYPGCAFTRSIGDYEAKSLGVIAEPETLVRDIEPSDKYVVVLASDGVFEFITNQTVCDVVTTIADPLKAATELVHMAYDLWLVNEIRTDDITAIVLKINAEAGVNIVLEDGDDGSTVISPSSLQNARLGSDFLSLGRPSSKV